VGLSRKHVCLGKTELMLKVLCIKLSSTYCRENRKMSRPSESINILFSLFSFFWMGTSVSQTLKGSVSFLCLEDKYVSVKTQVCRDEKFFRLTSVPSFNYTVDFKWSFWLKKRT